MASYSIIIQPILTNGDASQNGKYIELPNKDRVDTIIFNINADNQQLILKYRNKPINLISTLYIDSINVSNFVTNTIPYGEISFVGGYNTNNDLSIANRDDLDYVLNNPLVNLIREGDIIKVYDTTYNSNTCLMVGTIGIVTKSFNMSGLNIKASIISMLSILSQSALVQSKTESKVDGQVLQPFIVGTFNFNKLLNALFSETIISETTESIKYYRGITNNVKEELAINTGGSALNKNTTLFAYTPPTSNKLECIQQTIYPYQRLFYIDNNGDFIITPMQTYFDKVMDWRFTMSGEDNKIQCSDVEVLSNATVSYNRVIFTLLNILQQFNTTTNTTETNPALLNAVGVATLNSQLKNRINDFVNSGKMVQTLFQNQELNANIIQNSGMLNIVERFRSLAGLKSYINVNSNSASLISNSNNSGLKYFVDLYSARILAEQYFSSFTVLLTVDTNLTYNTNLRRYRDIPLNQMVYMPSVTNNMFDGESMLYCYGYRHSFNVQYGAKTTLYLCKPYSYMPLWCDKTELIS